MGRREFSLSTKRAGLERSGGICECGCGRAFSNHPKERPEYDHIVPDALGGGNDLENLQVIRVDCHLAKTSKRDVRAISKAKRGERDRYNLKPSKARSLPGSKASGVKMKIGGGFERR